MTAVAARDTEATYTDGERDDWAVLSRNGNRQKFLVGFNPFFYCVCQFYFFLNKLNHNVKFINRLIQAVVATGGVCILTSTSGASQKVGESEEIKIKCARFMFKCYESC